MWCSQVLLTSYKNTPKFLRLVVLVQLTVFLKDISSVIIDHFFSIHFSHHLCVYGKLRCIYIALSSPCHNRHFHSWPHPSAPLISIVPFEIKLTHSTHSHYNVLHIPPNILQPSYCSNQLTNVYPKYLLRLSVVYLCI